MKPQTLIIALSLVCLTGCGTRLTSPVSRPSQGILGAPRYHWEGDGWKAGPDPYGLATYRVNQWGTDLTLDDGTPDDPRLDPSRTGKNP